MVCGRSASSRPTTTRHSISRCPTARSQASTSTSARGDLRRLEARLHDPGAPLRHDRRADRAGQGHDAAIAAIASTPATRDAVAFTEPYYTTPARFVARAADAAGLATPAAFAGKTIGVVAGTAHEAYLRAFFGEAKRKPYPARAALLAALKLGQVDAAFGDAIAFAVWLNGTESGGCCGFRGGPFTESRFFGNGVSIAVGKDNVVLREALDLELSQLAQNGTYGDLYLKWFPIGFY